MLISAQTEIDMFFGLSRFCLLFACIAPSIVFGVCLQILSVELYSRSHLIIKILDVELEVCAIENCNNVLFSSESCVCGVRLRFSINPRVLNLIKNKRLIQHTLLNKTTSRCYTVWYLLNIL